MKLLEGKVVGKKMAKTATVMIERKKANKLYKKGVTFTKKYQVHDELDVRVGDKVSVAETRPFSKTKKWKIVEVLNK